ncbi:Stk1 family PASTA domain-containing Ser/Thr kinase [Streptomyces justiciae]|uniref:Stk1 family PASTA domain-containing Ser/Thr kinase n=1 Tax=Streptomyces justiciae TaxID=2780140 RepID=UPI00187F419F|nr:PASTA domain-containing protein [Streptomyces justiciae]MBE8470001.1 PASTA domain-containing protein [Streptomyces justiciae]
MNFGGPDDLAFSHPAPVAVLGDRYELRLLLGSGGMAEVHLAHDLRLDRSVAVKTLRTDLAHDPALQERFRREAQSTASLNHPAIAAVYDTGEHHSYGAQLPYLVMEYVDGATLREALYSGPPLTVERALEMTAGILEALAHSHQHGIVHRDIKPANVMVTWAGQVKVMDFGIARDARDVGMTQTSMVIGTAQYLSPEQAMGQAIDARSDLYSVGCLLYELLTLRTPFTGESPMAVMYQHVQEEPRPPSLYNPEVGPRVDTIVLRALTKDPAYRYQSAGEMLADVEAYLGAQTVLDRDFDGGDEEPDGGDPAESGRRRGSAALIGLGVAVVVAALMLGWFMFGRGTADDGKADVPDLVGQTLEEARRTADNVGLTLTVSKKKPCADQPKDHICEQTPVNGELDKGDAVSVTVSTGAPKVEVPDVTDKDEDDASRILEDKGFKVKLRHKVSDEDAGTVLEQDPAGGKSVEKGTEITLTVAKEAEKSTVPDLTGSTLREARKLLAEHDLELGDTTEVESSAEAGTVVEQSASAGDEVEPGTSVDVQIAKSVQTVQIPTDIVGKTLAEVQDELGGLGLQVTVASGYSQASDAVVTSSTSAAGSEVEAGSTVVVVTEEAQDTSSDDGTPADDTATTPATRGDQ